ncbi:hypothetical protein CANARDRAFT_27337 [[Candida] arabinofermentans NRRL YB-2248]|uniref:Uncharacterized protein n=1 Tax=[Candida] arabinofermentans NRRL YB-2248 TaxID=983967 RepID=A0A1E4T5K2_9ASCO|nr:hypothetical protein CANARDRAFT_27337 [[Candida] arabinofermentans NRRL YB-2248]
MLLQSTIRRSYRAVIGLRHYNNFNTPPTYFNNGSNPPKTLDEIREQNNHHSPTYSHNFSQQNVHSMKQQPHQSSSIPSYQSASPPPSSSSSSPPPLSNPPRKLSSDSIKELATSLPLIFLLSMALGWYINDQIDREKEHERELKMLKKNQKEMLIQMQNYKKKVALHTVELTKKDVLIQGKMQMHIALLREQLIENGIEPVKIDQALEKFEEEVKMQTTLTTIDLWVPGESRLKSYIPDAHEYANKR